MNIEHVELIGKDALLQADLINTEVCKSFCVLLLGNLHIYRSGYTFRQEFWMISWVGISVLRGKRFPKETCAIASTAFFPNSA